VVPVRRFKRLHVDWNSFIIWCGPDTKNERGHSQMYRPSLGIAIDFPWSEDHRLYGCPIRVNLHLWRWFAMVGQKSQEWTRKKGTTERWRWITWHPDHRTMGCRAPIVKTRFGVTKEWECSRLRGHRGEHA
jgi:hypothetical protein